MRLFTAGHSTRAPGALEALLAESGVRALVDVRRFPGSRRHPHFAQDALRAALSGAGIEYHHEPDLGGRRQARPDSPNLAWRNAAFRGYADHMATPVFRAALARLWALAERAPTAVLCAEALPWRCHRQLIADALVARGAEVVHLLGPGQWRVHERHPAAREGRDGSLTYPAAQERQPALPGLASPRRR